MCRRGGAGATREARRKRSELIGPRLPAACRVRLNPSPVKDGDIILSIAQINNCDSVLVINQSDGTELITLIQM